MRPLNRLKVQVARAMCSPLVGRALGVLLRDEISSRGASIDTSSSVVSDSVKAQLFWGLYESGEIRLIQKHMPSQFDVLEFGSSLGVVSSHIARRLAPGRRLFCFEGNPNLTEEIRRNVQRNAPEVKLEVINSAIAYLAEGRSSVRFHVSHVNVASKVADAAEDADAIEVPALRLEEVLSRFAIEDYALVSDIEGAEAGFIFRSGAALARCKALIIELHETRFDGRSVGVEEMVQALIQQGFRLRERNGPVCAFTR